MNIYQSISVLPERSTKDSKLRHHVRLYKGGGPGPNEIVRKIGLWEGGSLGGFRRRNTYVSLCQLSWYGLKIMSKVTALSTPSNLNYLPRKNSRVK